MLKPGGTAHAKRGAGALRPRLPWCAFSFAPSSAARSPTAGPLLAAGALPFAGLALDLDAPRFTYRRGPLDGHLQDAILEASPDPVLLHALRQRHAPPERAVPALPDVIPSALGLLLELALTGDGQNPVMNRDVHVLELHARKLGPYHQIPVPLEHVHGRRPLGDLRPLLTTRPTHEAAEHLVEYAVHLALHVVEPPAPERTHRHLPYLLLSPVVLSHAGLARSRFTLYPPTQLLNNFTTEIFCLYS